MREFSNFIDGAWVQAAGVIPVDDPSTGEVWGLVPDTDGAGVDHAVAAARKAFDGPWSRLTSADRADALRRLATALEGRFDELVDEMIIDSGATARFCP